MKFFKISPLFFGMVCAIFLPASEGRSATLPVKCSSSSSKVLSLVYPQTSQLQEPFRVSFTLEKGVLKAHFEVKTAALFAKEVFGPEDFPYQFDVTELFLSFGGGGENNYPYFEFEVSPYNQTYQVRVREKGKPVEERLELCLQSQAKIVKGGWTSDFSIPLMPLGWNGNVESIVGNAYGIAGQKPNRSYWGLTLPREEKPNFHKPEFFQKLFSKEECVEDSSK